jgi:polysaccharide pyruvyl transferase WcaK-like protein
MTVKLTQLLKTTPLDHSLLLGYYGGGNYGDELLLEVLCNLLVKHRVQDVTITYDDPANYSLYHHDFGYERIAIRSKTQILKALLRKKNIIIGGGGLWGVDMNFNTFLLSVMLLGARLLGKRVYLLGVGYYNSTNRLGHAGAWLAAKAARVIIARDQETLTNFSRYTRRVWLDSDIAWQIKNLNLDAYQPDVAELDKKLHIKDKTLCIALRRPQAKRRAGEFLQFTRTVDAFIAANPARHVLIALLESEAKSPAEYAGARAWQQKYPGVQVLDFPHNPLALYLLMRKHHKQLALIGPQFHIIIAAHLAGAPFLPMIYDNKVTALFDQLQIPKQCHIPLAAVGPANLQTFADNFFEDRSF